MTGDDDGDEEEDPDVPTPRRMTPAPTFAIPSDPFFDEEDVDNDHTEASHPPPASSKRRTAPSAAPTETRPEEAAAAAARAGEAEHGAAQAAPAPTPQAAQEAQSAPAAPASPEPQREAAEGGAMINLKGDAFDIFEPGDHTLLAIPRGSAADKSQLTVRARVDNVGPPCNGWLFLTRIELEGKWLDSIRQFVAWTNMDGENDVFRGIHFKVNYSTSRFGFNVSEFADNIPSSVAKVQTFPGLMPKNVGDYVTTLLVTFKWRASTSQVRMVYQKEIVGFSNSMWFTTTSLKDVKGEIGGILGADDHASSAKIPPQCIDKRRRNIARRAPPHRGTVHATAFLEPSTES